LRAFFFFGRDAGKTERLAEIIDQTNFYIGTADIDTQIVGQLGLAERDRRDWLGHCGRFADAGIQNLSIGCQQRWGNCVKQSDGYLKPI